MIDDHALMIPIIRDDCDHAAAEGSMIAEGKAGHPDRRKTTFAGDPTRATQEQGEDHVE